MLKTKTYLLVLGATVVFLLTAAGMRGEQKTSRAVWEYKIVQFRPSNSTTPSDLERIFNEQGSNGWELISNEIDETGPTPPSWKLYHFKRAK
jgi:hypothetical protein